MPEEQKTFTEKPFTILVIGDWVVDDNWVIGRHPSEHGSLPGKAHYNSLHHAGSLVRQVNAAGRVAAFLHDADWSTHTHRRCLIRGIGVWHDNDTGYLEMTFSPKQMTGSNPYRITGPYRPSKQEGDADSERTKQREGDDDEKRTRLFNFGQCLERFGIHNFGAADRWEGEAKKEDQKHDTKDGKYYGTTRVYRVFESRDGRLDQLSRVDWELPPRYEDGRDVSLLPPCTDPAWLETLGAYRDLNSGKEVMKAGTTRKQIEQWLRDAVGNVDAVVVKDNGKGMMTRQLIDLLFAACPALRSKPNGTPGVPWFVATKKWEPDWLKRLVEVRANVRAVVFQQAATHDCTGVNTWVSGHDHVTGEAAGVLADWARRLAACDLDPRKPIRRMVMVTPDRFQAVARVSGLFSGTDTQDKAVLLQPKPNPEGVNTDIGVGLGSAVLSALVYGLLQTDHLKEWPEWAGVDDNELVGSRFLVGGALRFAQRWVKDNYDQLKHPHTPAVPDPLRLKLNLPSEPDKAETRFAIRLGKLVSDHPMKVAPQDLSGVGHTAYVPQRHCLLDTPAGTNPFESIFVWAADRSAVTLLLDRGSVELEGYVCLVRSKREVIAGLARRFQQYKSHPARYTHAMAGLLMALPGSGKSHLVRKLAKANGLELLSMNISNLNRREELLSEFDQVVTKQANLRGDNRLLVFVDEVDATVEGRPVYDAFLTPLEDGYYVRGGLRFHIKPCLWLFVGTSDEAAIRAAVKGNDFVSRMTYSALDMRGDQRADDETNVAHVMQENILMGANLARALYPELEELDRAVVVTLASLPSTASVRDIKHLIESELEVVGAGRGRWKRHGGTVELRVGRLWRQAGQWRQAGPWQIHRSTPTEVQEKKIKELTTFLGDLARVGLPAGGP